MVLIASRITTCTFNDHKHSGTRRIKVTIISADQNVCIIIIIVYIICAVIAGIDGYSRLVTYLNCSDNNTARTVLRLFIQATREHGFPSRVRSDYGMENMEVARLMIQQMGTNRGSHITGSSVHNQRIERLWREVNRIVCRPYRNLFFYLEGENMLDPLDGIHLYCLHAVFLPRINHSLQEFVQQINNHPVRTERNMSPRQMFVSGVLADESASRLLLEDRINPRDFGVDEDGA